MLRERGFTLTEVLVSLAIVLIAVVSFYTVFSYFANFAKNRALATCVYETAYSALSLCMKGIKPPERVYCGNVEVIIDDGDTCNIPDKSCQDVQITARAVGLSIMLNGYGCNF